VTRPLKRPIRVALTDYLPGVQSVPVKPSRVQLAISKPAHLLRAAAQAAALLTVSTDWLGDARPRPDQAFSLSLVMGLTTIWVCPQKYTQVQNPLF